jgi:hypothetical protein
VGKWTVACVEHECRSSCLLQAGLWKLRCLRIQGWVHAPQHSTAPKTAAGCARSIVMLLQLQHATLGFTLASSRA